VERAEQGVDLEQRVLALLGRVHREPERDRAVTVRHAQADSRLGQATRGSQARRVADEHPHVGVGVEARQVQPELLVDACLTRRSETRRRMLKQIGHCVLLPFRGHVLLRSWMYGPDCSSAELPGRGSPERESNPRPVDVKS